MTQTEQVTVEIADTEVTYEAAECASCEQQYNVDEMTPMLVGEYEPYHGNLTYRFDNKPDKLYFCSYCTEKPTLVHFSHRFDIPMIFIYVFTSMLLTWFCLLAFTV